MPSRPGSQLRNRRAAAAHPGSTNRHCLEVGLRARSLRPLGYHLLMKVVTFLIAAILLTTISAQADQGRPNVVILFTDDQGTLDANCYGSTDLQTPNIDELAATGVRFTQAYAHTVCCPARAAAHRTASATWRRQPLDAGRYERRRRDQHGAG